MDQAEQIQDLPPDLCGRADSAQWASAEGVPFQLSAEVEFWKAGADIDPKKAMRVGGLVSTEKLDRDNERVVSSGLDFSECIQWGWFNDDHIKGSVLGVPEWAQYLRKGQQRPSGREAVKDGWYTEGYLIDTPRAKEVYETAVALQGTGRSLGFSIEGKILQKSPGLVGKALVREIAITKKPVNTDTYMDLPTLAKALEAGSQNPPVGGTPGDGGPLRAQSLQGAVVEPQRSKTMDKFEQFEADRDKKGMSKGEYQKALDKDDPDGGKLYASMCETNDAKKSLRDHTEANGRLQKSLENLTGVVAGLQQQVAIKQDELSKSVVDTGEGVDVGPFIAEMSDQVCRSSDGIVKALGTVGRATVATGQLVARLEKAVASRDAEIADLKKEVADLAKSMAELGSSPMLRRGASNLQEAEALARRLGAKTADGKSDVPSMLKSLQGQWEQIAAKPDRNSQDSQRLDALGHLLSLAETGYVDQAVAKAQKQGFLAAG